MKILIIVSNFLPEIGSAAHIYYDLATAFVKKGHEVDVITSYPRKFYLDKTELEREFPLEETINGIKIHRYNTKILSRDNIILRGLEHFILPVSYFLTYTKLRNKFDVCLIYIPPLPLNYLGWLIKKIDNTPYILNIQDFHPQELVDVGMLKNRLIIKIMEHIEKSSYRHADYITVITKAGKDLIISRGGNPSKITNIYNSIDISNFDSSKVKHDFKLKENIEGKLLVTYAGILSPFQGIDQILDAAKLMMTDKDIIFYIVGDGMEKDHILNRIYHENIINVKLLPLQPREEYLNIINSSDICIVTLDKRMSAPIVPGKFINILSMGKPIIASVPLNSDVANIINSNKCGIVTNPDKPELIVSAINKMKDTQYREQLGHNGYRFLMDNMDLNKAEMSYEIIFNKLLSGQQKSFENGAL